MASRWAIFVALLSVVPLSQAQQHRFTAYSAEDGLSQLVTHALFQDSAGYIWIGTEAGLNRYDGHRFQVYGIREGLRSDAILDVAEDHSGALWVGTRAGLSRIASDGITNYGIEEGLPGERVATVLVDGDGFIWCGGRGGLARGNATGFSAFDISHGLPPGQVNTLLMTQDQRIWVGTDLGLFYFSNDRFFPAEIEAPSSDPAVFALVEDAEQQLWVGRRDGVSVYRGSERIALYTATDGLPNVQPRHQRLIVDRFGIVWASGETGLAKIHRGRVETITPNKGLPFGDVRALLEDREGILWVGGFGGVAKFLGRAFTNYTQMDGLGASNVRPIIRGREGELWVGTMGGLSRFNGDEWRNYGMDEGLSGDIVLTLKLDSRERLWVGTTGGLDYLENDTFHNVDFFSKKNFVRGIEEDQEGRLWFSTSDERLYTSFDGKKFDETQIEGQQLAAARLLVDARGWVWVSGANGLSRWNGDAWHTYTMADGLAHNRTYHITEDRSGHIWFGYRGSFGLTHFDGQKFTTYTTADGLTNDAVYSIGVDLDNNLWVGTARGVDRFDGEIFVNYSPAEGYASYESNSGGFLADTDGTIWFATAEGLSHYNPRYDYLLDRQPYKPAILDLMFGSISGQSDLIVPYQHHDLRALVAPMSSIRAQQLEYHYRLQGYNEQWHPLHGYDITYTNLPPGVFHLEVRGRKRYGPWSETIGASFKILPPLWRTWWFQAIVGVAISLIVIGIYRWRIRRIAALNAELEYKVATRTDELEQSKRLLETQKRNLEETLDELQTTKGELIRSAHKAGMADIATSVLHDVGNVLNSVYASASLIRETLENSKFAGFVKANQLLREHANDLKNFITHDQRGEALLQYYLKIEGAFQQEHENLQESGLRIIEKIDVINEVILAQSKFAESSGGYYELVSLEGLIVDVLTLQARTIDRHQIEAEYDIGNAPRVMVQKAKFIEVLLNLTHNAMQAMEDKEISQRKLSIWVTHDDSNVCLHVSDTGCGIGKSELEHVFSHGYTSKKNARGFGLHSAANYMREMKGAISAHSDGLGKGSTFTLRLPLPEPDHQAISKAG